jgi:hypothetical protein
MTQSRLVDRMQAPLDPERGSQRARDGSTTDPPPRSAPEISALAPSRISTAALALAVALVGAVVLGAAAGLLELLSERQVVWIGEVGLGGTFLTATLAALGWMHSSKRVDGLPDPRGRRRALIAGGLASAMLVLLTLALSQLAAPQGVISAAQRESTRPLGPSVQAARQPALDRVPPVVGPSRLAPRSLGRAAQVASPR